MFCPECHSEYREGFKICSDCDVALVAELTDDDDGEAPALAPVAQETSAELVAELIDRLEKAGIPYVIQAGTALPLLDDDVEALDEPLSWAARVFVAAKFAEDAEEIVVAVQEEMGTPRRTYR